jgi:hypothetical protein
MKKNTHESSPRDLYTAMQLGDVFYLPHYRNMSVYVGPGYPRINQNRFSKEELLSAGAKAVEKMMWLRGEHGIVNSSNP